MTVGIINELQEQLKSRLIARGASTEDAEDAAFATGLSAEDLQAKIDGLGGARAGTSIQLNLLLAQAGARQTQEPKKEPEQSESDATEQLPQKTSRSPLEALNRAVAGKAEKVRQRCENVLAGSEAVSEEVPQEVMSAPSSNEPAANLLPAKPDGTCMLPNSILRSALACVVHFPEDYEDSKTPFMLRKSRPFIMGRTIAAVHGTQIRYTGPALNMYDIDAWEAVVNFSQEQATSTVTATAYQLLKYLEKTDTGANRAALHNQLLRLSATAVEIQCGSLTYVGSLIDHIYRADSSSKANSKRHEKREYQIQLNPNLIKLFGPSQFTFVDMRVRNRLGKNLLAKWLHAFYSSHAQPLDYRDETLRELCGSAVQCIRKFRQQLRTALSSISEACDAEGQAFDFDVSTRGLVSVSRSPTASQQKHLQREAAKGRAKGRAA